MEEKDNDKLRTTISCQRWAWELFTHTAREFGCSLDQCLFVAARHYMGSSKERVIKGYWSTRITTHIILGESTHKRLGVLGLGVWDLKDKHNDKAIFNSQSHKIGAIIAATVMRLPEYLIKEGYALSETDRRFNKRKKVELPVPNGIYLEMMRESQERKLSYNALCHEAILQTPKIAPLAFGSGSKRMAFSLDQFDMEKIESLSSIHQLDYRDTLRMILGAFFFVGEPVNTFIPHEDGTKSEIWD